MNPHKLELLKRIVKTFLFSMSLIVVAVSLGSPVGVIVLFFYAYLILFRPDEIQYLFNKVTTTPWSLFLLIDKIKKLVIFWK